MALDAREELREMIRQVGEMARSVDPKTEAAELWGDPRLWLSLEGKDLDDDVLMTMFVAGMLAREIEITATPNVAIDAAGFKRRTIGNEVAEGTIPPDKRSPPMTANEVAEAHGVFGHSNPSKWLKDAYLQFERLGKKFIVDQSRFQSSHHA